MTNVPVKKNIGPIYQWLAGLALVGGVVVGLLHAHHDHPLSVYDVIWLGLIILLCLALWRPEAFDQLMKTIADRVPFIKYEKGGSK